MSNDDESWFGAFSGGRIMENDKFRIEYWKYGIIYGIYFTGL